MENLKNVYILNILQIVTAANDHRKKFDFNIYQLKQYENTKLL